MSADVGADALLIANNLMRGYFHTNVDYASSILHYRDKTIES